MRFGLFRRFSYLIHRRTRSDSALLSQTTQTPEFLPSSLSLDGVQQQRDPSATRVIDTVLPPAPVLSPLLPNYIPPYSEDPTLRATANASALSAERSSPRSSTAFTTEGNFNEPLLRLSAAQKHVAELAAQSSHLKASLEALRVESGDVEGAINKARNDLGLARSLANCQKRTSADLELKVNAKRHELAQFQAFAQALSEVNLVSVADTRPGPVTSSETTDNANHFEEKAVEAIRKASSDDASIWSKIISLVIGPRAPENYVNAINMTLQARQELRYWRKVSNFWKKTARESSTNAGAPTPSTSNLSEIRETLSDERKKAVQDLREKRKTIGLDATCNISESSIESLSSINAVKLSYRLPDSQPSFTSAMSTMSIIASNSYSPITKTTNRLPPLASDIFKQDLLSSHSSQRLFSTSSHKALWTFANTQAQVASNPSDKALGKSKAIEFRDSVASMPSAGSSSHSNISQNGSTAVNSSSSGGHLSSWASFESDIQHQITPVSHLWTTPKSSSDELEPVHNSLKSAERALVSFERICHRFSSGSNVASLQSISEESSLSNATPENGPQIVVHIPEEQSSESLSSGSSTSSSPSRSMGAIEEEHSGLPLKIKPEAPFEGDITLVESGSGSNREVVRQENDTTLIEIEPFSKAEGIKASVENDLHQEPSPVKKTRLPIFKIPNRLSQMSRMTGSSSKKSLSSFRSRNSSSTISTVASREPNGPRSLKRLLAGMPAFKPVLPLRIVKKGTQTAPIDSHPTFIR